MHTEKPAMPNEIVHCLAKNYYHYSLSTYDIPHHP